GAECCCHQERSLCRLHVVNRRAVDVVHGSQLPKRPSIFAVQVASALCLQNQRLQHDPSWIPPANFVYLIILKQNFPTQRHVLPASHVLNSIDVRFDPKWLTQRMFCSYLTSIPLTL